MRLMRMASRSAFTSRPVHFVTSGMGYLCREAPALGGAAARVYRRSPEIPPRTCDVAAGRTLRIHQGGAKTTPSNETPTHCGPLVPEGVHAMARPPMLKLAEVLEEIDMSRAAFYRMRARGKAPRLIKLPNGQLRVRRTDLDNWLSDCEQVAA